MSPKEKKLIDQILNFFRSGYLFPPFLNLYPHSLPLIPFSLYPPFFSTLSFLAPFLLTNAPSIGVLWKAASGLTEVFI